MKQTVLTLSVPVVLTKDDLAAGCRSHTNTCPIALALSRALNATALVHRDVLIRQDSIEVSIEGVVWKVQTPETFAKFISNYDNGAPLDDLNEYLGYCEMLEFTIPLARGVDWS